MYSELNVTQVKMLLIQQGKSTKELAAAMGVVPSSLYQIYSGTNTISFKGFLAMCNFLNVEPQILLK